MSVFPQHVRDLRSRQFPSHLSNTLHGVNDKTGRSSYTTRRRRSRSAQQKNSESFTPPYFLSVVHKIFFTIVVRAATRKTHSSPPAGHRPHKKKKTRRKVKRRRKRGRKTHDTNSHTQTTHIHDDELGFRALGFSSSVVRVERLHEVLLGKLKHSRRL